MSGMYVEITETGASLYDKAGNLIGEFPTEQEAYEAMESYEEGSEWSTTK